MTKNEFEILTFIHSSQKGVSGIDVINHFKELNTPIERKAYLIILFKKNLITSKPPALFDLANTFTITDEGINAVEEYREEEAKLNQTEKNAKFSKTCTIITLILTVLSFAFAIFSFWINFMYK